MQSTTNNPLSSLRGASRLVVDAIVGVTDLVETMHHTFAPAGRPQEVGECEGTAGLTGIVCRNIRTVSGLVGGSLDAALAPLEVLLGDTDSSAGAEAVTSAVNGVLGDYLVATNNPLAIPMRLRRHGEPVSPDDPAFCEAVREARGRLVVLIHGAAASDLQWNRKGHDHGAELARAYGYLPVYLRYNSGRHISTNGAELNRLLERVVAELPGSVDLSIIGHSMGGLVARSAHYYGRTEGRTWADRLQKLVCLGSPHHGTPLERYGNRIDQLLEVSEYSAPLSRLGKIRSAGITDLRYGNLVDEDWEGRDRFAGEGDDRRPIPLPDGVKCYAIAGTTGHDPGGLAGQIIGDGMVPVDSALGRHERPEFHLRFPESRRRIICDTTHLGLLGDSNVWEVLEEWFG